MFEETPDANSHASIGISDFLHTKIGRNLLIVTIIGLMIRYIVGIFFTYPTDVNYWVIVSENLFSNEGLYGLPGYY